MRAVLAVFFLLILAPAAAAAPNVEIRRTSHGRIRVTAKTSRTATAKERPARRR